MHTHGLCSAGPRVRIKIYYPPPVLATKQGGKKWRTNSVSVCSPFVSLANSRAFIGVASSLRLSRVFSQLFRLNSREFFDDRPRSHIKIFQLSPIVLGYVWVCFGCDSTRFGRYRVSIETHINSSLSIFESKELENISRNIVLRYTSNFNRLSLPLNNLKIWSIIETTTRMSVDLVITPRVNVSRSLLIPGTNLRSMV